MTDDFTRGPKNPCGCNGHKCTLSAEDPRHGTPNGYNNLRCRCAPCKKAWAASHRDYLDRYPEQRDKAAWRERNKRNSPNKNPIKRRPFTAPRKDVA